MQNREEQERREKELREKVSFWLKKWADANQCDALAEIETAQKTIIDLLEKHWEVKERLLKLDK